ncbi:MAG TPA: hypothetical protein PKL49_02390 [Steroidobacteraceae bacterium]|nr:hypothetical protein [Steroidobacteraceae bacterium]
MCSTSLLPVYASDVLHIARVDRQQRRGAAEQHREQVERDRPEQRLVAYHEAQAFERVAQVIAVARTRDPHRPYAQHQYDDQYEQQQHAAIHDLRAGEEQQPADRRPRDHRHLEQRGIDGHGRAEVLRRHEVRRHRLAGRHPERASGAEEEHRHEDRPGDPEVE